jgi:Zn-dependent protease
MDAGRLFAAGVQYLLFLLALSVREAARAWTADRLGDPTVRSLGRVSLNPARHFDLFGTLLLPSLLLAFGAPVFGWGRPAPVTGQGFRRPWRDGILAAAAGPMANFLFAAIATFALVVAVAMHGADGRQAALQALLPLLPNSKDVVGLSSYPLMFTLVRMATINAFLGVFFLIPVPPLDGGTIALHLLPPDWAEKLAAIRPYGIMIGMALAVFNVVTLVLLPFYGILSVLVQLV